MSRSSSSGVAVIGGGLIGLSCALALLGRGHSVTVIDPGTAMGRASYGNAGVISRGSIFPMAAPGTVGKLFGYALGHSPAVRLNIASLPRLVGWGRRFVAAANDKSWRAAASALDPMVRTALAHHLAWADDMGTRHFFRNTGYLRLYRTRGGLAAALHELDVLAGHGIVAQPLDALQVGELEPSLAPRYAEGLFFPQAASVDGPGAIVDAFAAHFRARGGTSMAGSVTAIKPIAGGVELKVSGQAHRFAKAVIAAGVRSARLARQLGDAVPLVAERGYHRHAPLAADAILNRPVYDVEGGFVVSPMGDGVRVLSGVELAMPDDPPHYGQIEAAFADAAQILPIERDAGGEIWMGSRPSTPDGLPVIGFSRASAAVAYAFGHGHIGFANAPTTGLAVAALLAGEAPQFPLAPFSPQRF